MLFIDSQQLRVSKPRTSPTKSSIFIGIWPRLTPRDLLWNSMFDLHRQTQSLSMKRSPFFMSEKTFFGWLYPLTQKSITCNGPWWFVNEIFRCDIFKEVYRRRMRRFQYDNYDIHQSAWPPDVWKILVRTISNLYLEVCCFWLYWTSQQRLLFNRLSKIRIISPLRSWWEKITMTSTKKMP